MISDLFFVGVGVFATMLVMSPTFRVEVQQTCAEAYHLVASLFARKK
jgi:hypothetical protein